MSQYVASAAAVEGTNTMPGRRGSWAAAGLGLFLLVYASVLAMYFAPAISEPDDNGYFAQGSLLAQTGATSFKSQSDAQYIGMHWLIAPSGEYVSRYPPGVAVLVAAVYGTLGYKASVLVNPTLALASLLGFYLLAKQIVPAGWALAGAILLGSYPTFFHHALGCDSHMAVLSALVWGMYWLLRWSAAGRWWQVFLAGLILGCIPSIRYGDAIMSLAVIVFLLWHRRQFPRIWRHWLAGALGAAIPIAPLLLHNQRLMGAFWKTGYSLTNEQTGFKWEYFRAHAIDYIRQMQGNGVGLMFALGAVGITLMICLRPWRKLGVMLALLTVPMLLLYMAYYWAPQQNSQATMRFVLPTFPAYVLAGVWALWELTRSHTRAARVAAPLALLAVQLLWGTSELVDQGLRMKYQREVLTRVTYALATVAGPEDVVVADRQMLQHLDFVRKWKLVEESVVRGDTGGGRFGAPGGDPDAPSPGQAEKLRVRRELYTGTATERQDKFEDDVLQWAGKGRVYVVGAPEAIAESMGGNLRGSLRIVARVKLPDAPPPPALEGMGGAARMNRPAGGGPGFSRRAGGAGGAGGRGVPAAGAPGGAPGGPAMMGRPGGGGFMGRTYGPEMVVAEWVPKN